MNHFVRIYIDSFEGPILDTLKNPVREFNPGDTFQEHWRLETHEADWIVTAKLPIMNRIRGMKGIIQRVFRLDMYESIDEIVIRQFGPGELVTIKLDEIIVNPKSKTNNDDTSGGGW